jgi:hypothetical protein
MKLMSTKSILENLKIVLLKPRALLLIDAVGAAVTTIANVFLLAGQRIDVGLPVEVLYAMAFYAACLVCFDVVALGRRIDPAIALRIIACANLGYCIIVIVALYVYRTSVTRLGFAYFGIEIPILVAIAGWEWTVASRRAIT